MHNYDRIMIWGAHPDDEILMAGTIAAHADAGAEVVVVTISRGDAGYCREEWAATIVDQRRQEAATCDEILGVSERVFLDWPDQGVRHDWKLTRLLIEQIRRHRPQALFTLGPDDRNRDHSAVHEMTDEIVWQAGENILADRGEPYTVPLVFIYHGHERMGPSIEVDVTPWASRKAEAWLSQTTQVEMLPRIRERMAKLKRVQEEGGSEIERFVIYERDTLTEFPALPE
ncbi:MAG: PIG-L family deacetylase [Armatimonadota bacterium]